MCSGLPNQYEAGFYFSLMQPTAENSQPVFYSGSECLSTTLAILSSLECIFFLVPSVQFSSVAQSCLTLCGPMNRSTPGLPVHHQLPEFTQTHVCRVGDAIHPSHPLSSPSPPAPNPLLASESFPMSQLFAWGGQSTGVSALASVPPKKSQG